MVARKSLGPTRAKRGSIIRRSKSDWRSAEGGFLKARRLHLRPDAKSGAYHCLCASMASLFSQCVGAVRTSDLFTDGISFSVTNRVEKKWFYIKVHLLC